MPSYVNELLKSNQEAFELGSKRANQAFEIRNRLHASQAKANEIGYSLDPKTGALSEIEGAEPHQTRLHRENEARRLEREDLSNLKGQVIRSESSRAINEYALNNDIKPFNNHVKNNPELYPDIVGVEKLNDNDAQIFASAYNHLVSSKAFNPNNPAHASIKRVSDLFEMKKAGKVLNTQEYEEKTTEYNINSDNTVNEVRSKIKAKYDKKLEKGYSKLKKKRDRQDRKIKRDKNFNDLSLEEQTERLNEVEEQYNDDVEDLEEEIRDELNEELNNTQVEKLPFEYISSEEYNQILGNELNNGLYFKTRSSNGEDGFFLTEDVITQTNLQDYVSPETARKVFERELKEEYGDGTGGDVIETHDSRLSFPASEEFLGAEKYEFQKGAPIRALEKEKRLQEFEEDQARQAHENKQELLKQGKDLDLRNKLALQRERNKADIAKAKASLPPEAFNVYEEGKTKVKDFLVKITGNKNLDGFSALEDLPLRTIDEVPFPETDPDTGLPNQFFPTNEQVDDYKILAQTTVEKALGRKYKPTQDDIDKMDSADRYGAFLPLIASGFNMNSNFVSTFYTKASKFLPVKLVNIANSISGEAFSTENVDEIQARKMYNTLITYVRKHFYGVAVTGSEGVKADETTSTDLRNVLDIFTSLRTLALNSKEGLNTVGGTFATYGLFQNAIQGKRILDIDEGIALLDEKIRQVTEMYKRVDRGEKHIFASRGILSPNVQIYAEKYYDDKGNSTGFGDDTNAGTSTGTSDEDQDLDNILYENN